MDSIPKILIKWQKWNENILYPFKHLSPQLHVYNSPRTKTNDSTFTFNFVILIPSPTNLVCDFISIIFVIEIISTYSCSWIVHGSFSSLPPPLRSCGFSNCTSSSWVAPLLRSCGSLVYTSSSYVVPLGLASFSSSWPNTSIFVGLPQINSGKFFW